MNKRTTDNEQRTTLLAAALPAIFFLSGAASLLFETLWFRDCGLVFGNSAWASAIVLASFMAGLAIGNFLSPRLLRRWRDPLRLYGTLEITIGICGLVLVLLLPRVPAILAPLFRVLLDSPLLNATRLILAFVLLLIPATVMGATLPTVVSALSRNDPNFGRVLGLLYGCNTIGAVAGALAGELLLIRLLGVRGTGVVAGGCSLTAGIAALLLRGGQPPAAVRTAEGRCPPRLLFAAALSGFALLALEVIWFRFVILFVVSTSVTFAVMLAVVLAGIGIGALIASTIWTRFPNADANAPIIAAASAVAVVLCYSGFEAAGPARYDVRAVFADSMRLMLPVSVLSGILFTVIGRAVEREVGDETRATALVTFANTVGAAIGPIVAGFVLIPKIGVEGSFFAIATLYAVIGVLIGLKSVPHLIAAAATVLTLIFFPFGLWKNYFLPNATRAYRDLHIVAVQEGPIETAVYLQHDVAGQPYAYKLFTNGYSMSGTAYLAKRYMSAFVYLPLALRPQTRSALLISYGVGMTAKRLTESSQLVSIDVVDISKTILDLGSIVWPGPSNPLRDPRVHVHVEDGRFFLLTTPRRFDLITAEPPPPKTAGIVNLYTREYFHLMRDRLTDDGIASYWLPVYQLAESDNKAIIGAFCHAFPDCSLWNGAGLEWILVGSRRVTRVPSYLDFSRQWRDPISAPALVRLGIETPEELAAMFIADATTLRRMVAGSPPLTDDYPLRLSPDLAVGIAAPIFPLMHAAPEAFARSEFIRRALPPEVRASAPAYFHSAQLVDRALLTFFGMPSPRSADVLKEVLTTTRLRTLPRMLLDTDPWLEDIALRARAHGNRDPYMAFIAAVGALSDRDYPRARDLFAEARRGLPNAKELPAYEALANSLAR